MIHSIRQKLPVVLISLVFAWSAIFVALHRVKEAPPGAKVIRIGHWQLEGGVREGFEVLAREFSARPEIRAKYGDVRVIQDAIPESIYGQWVSTQMMGQTAPDLLEVGLGLPGPVWLAYQNRYFEPLTHLATAPNPFNRGTTLQDVPLKNTIGDGMRTGYQEELQQYMRVPLSRFTTRVFYNRDLLRQLTGLDKPPIEYRAFVATCRTIASKQDAQGAFYVPIASSKYHAGMWQGGVSDPLTFSLLFKADFNRDGFVGNDETFVGYRTGSISFDTPAIRSKFVTTQELQRQFQPGFTGLTRDEAIFLFAQQRAVFISTGTWDAGSLIEQAKGKYEIGAMAFPPLAADDPEFGPLVLGPNFDPAGQGFMFGVTRFSKHPELARDFLLYLASRDGNRRLNEVIGWIPSVVDAPLPPLLSDFRPVNQGMYSNLNLELGGETVVRFQQLYSLFQNDPAYTYEQFAKDFAPFYASRGQADWQEQQRDWRRVVLNNERFLTALRGQAMAGDERSADAWRRYRAYLTARQVMPEINHAEQRRLVAETGEPVRSPYEYRPEAIARVREALQGKSPNLAKSVP